MTEFLKGVLEMKINFCVEEEPLPQPRPRFSKFGGSSGNEKISCQWQGADNKVEIFSEKYTDKNKPRIEIEFVEIDEKKSARRWKNF